MPLLETPDGLVIGQCVAIASYVGRVSGASGSTEADRVKSDMMMAEGEDLYALLQKNNDTMFASPGKVSKEALVEFWTGGGKGSVGSHMACLEALCTGGGFTAGGKTTGEVYLFGMIYQMSLIKGDFMDASPKVKAWFDGLAADENVQTVLTGKSCMGILAPYFQEYEQHSIFQ